MQPSSARPGFRHVACLEQVNTSVVSHAHQSSLVSRYRLRTDAGLVWSPGVWSRRVLVRDRAWQSGNGGRKESAMWSGGNGASSADRPRQICESVACLGRGWGTENGEWGLGIPTETLERQRVTGNW